MNQSFIIILLLLGIVLFYITKNREGFLNYRKSCVVVNPHINNMDFKVVGGTLSNRTNKKDYGFIRDVKRTYYGKQYKTADIEYGELKEIINRFSKDFENKSVYEFRKISSVPDISKINKFIMDYLNKHITAYLLKLDIHIINSYKIINQDILYVGEGENFYNYRFVISIFRFGTDMYFNIYFDIISSKLKNSIKINLVRIIGLKIKTDTVSEEYNKCILDKKHCNLHDDCDINCNHILHKDPHFKTKLGLFIKQVENENIKIRLEGNFKCYKKFKDSYIVDPKLTNKQICEDNKGIWDRPCYSNPECPFYNISHVGGCVKGECVFPWGIERYSPRKYNPESEALCKGCREGYRCCSEQNPPNYIFMDTLEKIDTRFNSGKVHHGF